MGDLGSSCKTPACMSSSGDLRCLSASSNLSARICFSSFWTRYGQNLAWIHCKTKTMCLIRTAAFQCKLTSFWCARSAGAACPWGKMFSKLCGTLLVVQDGKSNYFSQRKNKAIPNARCHFYYQNTCGKDSYSQQALLDRAGASGLYQFCQLACAALAPFGAPEWLVPQLKRAGYFLL